MSIGVVNSPFSAGDIIETANVLSKYGICIGSGHSYGYFIFIEPRLLCKMKKLMFLVWVAKPNRKAL